MTYLYGSQVIKDKILTNISAAIREVHRLAVDDESTNSPITITNDHWQVHCLLEHLDFALLYGLKHVHNGYYDCVRELTPKPLIKQIQSLLNIETNIGRGRAWLFFALNDGLTESYMKCFQDNRKLVKKFYTSDAIVNDIQRLIALTTLCSGLENIQFNLKIDCVYFDRGCWPAYFQVDLQDTEKLQLPGIRNDVPSFASYLSRYDIQHVPTLPTLLPAPVSNSKRVRVPRRIGRTSTASSLVNSFISSDLHLPTTPSRSSSVSCDNPSIDGLSLNDENQVPNSRPIATSAPSPLAAATLGLSSSLSELDPMLATRPRSPSPSPFVDLMLPATLIEQISPTTSTADEEQLPIIAEPIPPATLILDEEQLPISQSINHQENDDELPASLPSPMLSHSTSIENGLDASVEKKNEDLLNITEEDALDLPADANLQLHFMLDVYEMQNEEEFLKLFPTTINHNDGNAEVVFLLITTLNIFLLRRTPEINGSMRTEKIQSIRLEKIDYIEVGPNEQFLRIITVKHNKLRSLTTGCMALTRAICASIIQATKLGRYTQPQILPASMQEISIKRWLANDMKKSIANDVKLLNYHYTFWEEPQMSGRNLRKDGVLLVQLIEPPTALRRISAATLKSYRHPFETWKNVYVTLRVDRLNVYLHKSDTIPALSYTLLDENCQGCRRNRNADREHAFEIMFANDITLLMAAKTKVEQDEWLNAIMKGLSQGHMATKDEQNSANTVPCSVILTEEKLYVCHDEQDNALIRQLDSIRLEHIGRLFVDAKCHNYCVLSIEHGNQGLKSWIFYFLFVHEMIDFIRAIQKAMSNTYQVPIDILPLKDESFQRECERTSKRLLRSYRPLKLT